MSSKDAFDTDFAALGLDFQSPFDILSQPRKPIRATTTPKKRGPKPRDCVAKTLAALSKPDNFNTHIASREESDRTGAIRGHSL